MTKRLAIYLTNTERSGWDKPYANYAAMIAELLAPLLPNHVIELFDAVTGKLPPVPEDYDGVVLTGSIANVTEQEPWMAELYEHIRRLDKARVKLVGICFGHQAIVHALGGLVGVAEPQVGCRTMVLQEQAHWMHPWQENISLYCGNFQQVQVLPAGFRVLASQEQCAVPLYAKGEHILGCQYHPEFDRKYAQLYLQRVEGKLSPAAFAREQRQLIDQSDGAVIANWLANFIDYKISQQLAS